VDSIHDIVWNDQAFSHLMLPDGYKDLVLSFVEGQKMSMCRFDDIIDGKGLGLNVLLVGNPGTGKTLTAEAVADKVRRPLYVFSAGELCQPCATIDYRLKNVLELTERWDAVLLFDECDFFFQERSKRHLDHNESVAVILR
jgi:SpoVK/Ycf46/Vps4 family AAA+-type ATPase